MLITRLVCSVRATLPAKWRGIRSIVRLLRKRSISPTAKRRLWTKEFGYQASVKTSSTNRSTLLLPAAGRLRYRSGSEPDQGVTTMMAGSHVAVGVAAWAWAAPHQWHHLPQLMPSYRSPDRDFRCQLPRDNQGESLIQIVALQSVPYSISLIFGPRRLKPIVAERWKTLNSRWGKWRAAG
jgi:hypothetical protein